MSVIPGGEERGPIADTLRRLYWDTAGAFSDPVLRMLRSVTGLHNVVFGSDYPYPANAISIAGLRQLGKPASCRTTSVATSSARPLCASCRGSLRRDASGPERRGLPRHAISDVRPFRRAGQAIKEWS